MSLFNTLFGNKQSTTNNIKTEQQPANEIYLNVLRDSVARKLGDNISFETTETEDAFFLEVIKMAMAEKLNPHYFDFEPLSNKGFSVYYRGYYIGKIKLRGRSTYMQLLKGLYTNKTIENLSLEEYITNIPIWIKHIKYCIK